MRVWLGKESLPAIPVWRDKTRLRLRNLNPAVGRFLAKKNGKRMSRRTARLQLPRVEVGGKAFADRFVRIEAEKPSAARRPQIVGGACIGVSGYDAGAVVARNFDGLVARAVVYDQNVVARIDGLEAAAEAESIVFGMQQGGDRCHEGKSVRETERSVRGCVNKEASQARICRVAKRPRRIADPITQKPRVLGTPVRAARSGPIRSLTLSQGRSCASQKAPAHDDKPMDSTASR